MKRFTSTPARATGRTAARGSRLTEAFQKTNSRSIFGRFNSAESYLTSRVEEHSNTPFRPLSEINNVLQMSVDARQITVSYGDCSNWFGLSVASSG